MNDYKILYAETRDEYNAMRDEAAAGKQDFEIRLKIDGRFRRFEKFRFDNGRLVHWEDSFGESKSFRYNAAGRIVYRGYVYPRPVRRAENAD